MTMKVGELARRAGLTVRTLHHYDAIGLLKPSTRSPAGHRLYGRAEILRLQQIKSLQQLGFPLHQIGRMLAEPGMVPLQVVEMHLDRLREQLARQERLVALLERVAEQLRAAEEPAGNLIIESIEAMTMFDKYYTPEQQQALAERRAEVGEERIRQVQQEWQQLYEDARIEMEKGTDPADEAVQALVRKSRELIAEFTGGDAGIHASLTNMWQQEASVREQYGPPPGVMEYLRKAGAVAQD